MDDDRPVNVVVPFGDDSWCINGIENVFCGVNVELIIDVIMNSFIFYGGKFIFFGWLFSGSV